MKKKVLLCVFALSIAFVVYSNFFVLSLNDVVSVFENEGLTLSKGEENPKSVFQMELNGEKPHVFKMNEQTLCVFVYATPVGSFMGGHDFERKTSAYQVVYHKRYAVKNVLVFYVPEGKKDSGVEAKIQKTIDRL